LRRTVLLENHFENDTFKQSTILSAWRKASLYPFAHKLVLKAIVVYEPSVTKQARQIFQTNLDGISIEPIDAISKVWYWKVYNMNALGLLRCFERDPPDHPSELRLAFERWEKSAQDWHNATAALPFSQVGQVRMCTLLPRSAVCVHQLTLWRTYITRIYLH
jgi:hypothetical protein